MIPLPNECLIKILSNFKSNYRCLFSCLLVNRHWCRIIVPFLWNEPTEYFNDKRLIRTYVLLLNAEEQTLLIPFEIIIPNYPKPLFEYTRYATSIGIYLMME
ncbi:f-box domain-containing protein [Gigaspora margarita]|uniref:F-box domain-containing protein n=1 Tax=Gigaspora margarita TaxID=4874 RepID=A0A8H3WX56_GIGMA|nr:f-box domain-containing protein [Gigaspora margarita]